MKHTQKIMSKCALLFLLLAGTSGSASAAVFIVDGGEWSDGASWDPAGVPGDNVDANINNVSAVVSDIVSSRSRPTIANAADSSGSLTINRGGFFTSDRSFSIASGANSSGTLTVAAGGRFEVVRDGTIPQFFMGQNTAGSATINVNGEMLLLGVGTNLNFRNDTEQQTIRLTDGYLQVPGITGLAGTDTNILFEIEKGLFIEKIDSDADRDALISLAENGFIDFSSANVNEAGWGMTQLGFSSYDDLDYSLVIGNNVLYIDNGAGTWAGDPTVLTMWVERSGAVQTLLVTNTSLSDSDLIVNFNATPGLTGFAVQGSTDLVDFSIDKTGDSVITEPTPGSYRASINVAGESSMFFIRISAP